jgi:predicted rRNA methylase YqxC with S4 and FtsJ domains
MRSDSYLVEKGFIKSRQWGKRGVKNELARVNGESKI